MLVGQEEQWEGWMPTLFNCGLTAGGRRKASFLEKSMDRGHPLKYNLHGSQPRKPETREMGRPLQQLRGEASPSPHQTDRKTKT